MTCRQRSLIDFAVVSADLKSYVMDVCVKRGAELSTDHHLVVCRLRIPTKVSPTSKRPIRAFRIKWENLSRNPLPRALQTTRLQSFPEFHLRSLMSKLRGPIQNGSTQCCRKSLRVQACRISFGGGRRTPWWTEDVRTAVKEKKKAYRAWLGNPTQASRQNYEDTRKLAKIAVASAKARSWENFGMPLEQCCHFESPQKADL